MPTTLLDVKINSPWQPVDGSPSIPSGHEHLKLPRRLVQRAERPQGLLKHSSTSMHSSSGLPSYPSGHSHLWAPGKLMQSAPRPHAPS